MANRLFELAIRLGKDEASRLERFDEVIRSTRQDALARGVDDAYRVASSIHDRFVNIRQPTASTLKQIVDVLRYDSAGLEALPREVPVVPRGGRERPLRGRDADANGADSDPLSEGLQGLQLSPPQTPQPPPLALASEQVPMPTLEIPELRAIFAEAGFAERVKASGIKVSRSTCLDVVRLLASGLLPRLQSVTVAWHSSFNMARKPGTCTSGFGEWGLTCPVCCICNTRMTTEMTYGEWANPGPTAAERRELKNVPQHIIILHPLFQCYHVRRLAQQASKGRPDLAWMLTELEPEQVQRILVASMIYQERAGK